MGQGIGHANLPKDLPARAHESARHAVNVFVDRFKAHGCVDRHGKERHQEGEQQARHGSGPEPHDEQRRNGDFRDDLRDHDHGVEAFSEQGGVRDQYGNEDAADHGKCEPEHCEIKRGPQMREQEIMALPHRLEYCRGRRQDDAADAQCPDADLPDQEQEHRDEGRPHDRGRTLGNTIPHGSPRLLCADGGPSG